MEVLQFVETGVTSAAAAKTILFPKSRQIKRVLFTFTCVVAAGTSGMGYDLSLTPVSLSTNDGVNSIIAACNFGFQVSTAIGIYPSSYNQVVETEFVMPAGAYLYLHRRVLTAGPTSASCWIYLYLK